MEHSNEHVHATWYYERAGQRVGPLSYSQIASLTAKGGLTAATLVWRSGLSEWMRLELTELVNDLPGVSASAAVTAAAAPARPQPHVPRSGASVSSAGGGPATFAAQEPVPPGVQGWSWGALLLSWIWAIRFRVWWGLLAAIPWLGLGAAVWLGFKGRELAWRKGHWSSLQEFNQVQRRWSIGGAVAAAVISVLMGVGYLHENPDVLADLIGAPKKGGTYVKAEDAFNDMGKVLNLPAEDPVPATGTAQPPEGSPPAAIAATTALAPTQGPERTEIAGDTFQTRGGTLRVVGDDQRGRHLELNGQPVPRVMEDELRLVAAYRYADHDTVLMTKACASAGCDWTWFLLVDVWPSGQVDVLSDDQLSIAAQHAVPEVTPQADGSLHLAFRGGRGAEQWRYAQGSLSKR